MSDRTVVRFAVNRPGGQFMVENIASGVPPLAGLGLTEATSKAGPRAVSCACRNANEEHPIAVTAARTRLVTSALLPVQLGQDTAPLEAAGSCTIHPPLLSSVVSMDELGDEGESTRCCGG